MTHEEMFQVVEDCHYLGVEFKFEVDGQRPYIQVVSGRWSGRKWMLSNHMTIGEIVQTVLSAVLMWTEHEVREHFKFRHKAIFNPHLSIKTLLERSDDIEVRE
jgi:hypothetical protein